MQCKDNTPEQFEGILDQRDKISQCKAAHHQDDNHDGELEKGIQTGGKDLRCC